MKSDATRASLETALYVARGASVPRLPSLQGTEIVSRPIAIPAAHPPFHLGKGTPFDAKAFWRQSGIDPDRATLVSLSVVDPYFLSPRAWRTLYELIAAIGQHAGANLEVTTWDPESHCQNAAGPNWFRMPAWGGHPGTPADVKCGSRIDLPLESSEAEAFAGHLRTQLGLRSATVDYSPNKPDHDRWMEYSIIVDGAATAGRVWVGKGFDILS